MAKIDMLRRRRTERKTQLVFLYFGLMGLVWVFGPSAATHGKVMIVIYSSAGLIVGLGIVIELNYQLAVYKLTSKFPGYALFARSRERAERRNLEAPQQNSDQ